MAPRLKYKNIDFLNHLGNADKPSLANIKRILKSFGDINKDLGIKIAITGTNGKGSVAKSLSTILKNSGFKVGLYTSPHLFKINERIQVNDKCISDLELDSYIKKIIDKQNKFNIKLSYFELLTSSAIQFFKFKKNDINIFEVGLGGKFDATNIIKSDISLITNVGKDHMEYLGNSISKIANEKAGIIKKRAHVITSATGIALSIIKNHAKLQKSEIYEYKKDFIVNDISDSSEYISDKKIIFKSSLKGLHQKKNLALTLKTCEILNDNFNLEIKKVQNSLSKVKWKCRFQILQSNPIKIVDSAHNINAFNNLIENLDYYYKNKKFIFLLGMLKDKNPINCIKKILPYSKKILLFNIDNPRSINIDHIIKQDISRKIVKANKEDFISHFKSNNNIIVTGSIYFIGEGFKKNQKLLG